MRRSQIQRGTAATWPRARHRGVGHSTLWPHWEVDAGDKPMAPVVVLLSRSVTLLLLLLLLLPGCRCSSESRTRYSYTNEFIESERVDFLRVWRPKNWEPLPVESCPPCDLLFGKLREQGLPLSPGRGNGGRIQRVELQERGEPKSGTGFMFEWAMSALSHTCRYLESAFGRGSCRIEWDFFNRTLIFDPRLAAGDRERPCECKSVESVVIFITNKDKHQLPVEKGCPWAHSQGMVARSDEHDLCTAVGHAPMKGEADLWRCMHTAKCGITADDHLQMAVLRDPRAVAVSSYFHLGRLKQQQMSSNRPLDNFALAFLPTTCMWVTLRFLLFEGMLSGQSTVYWYEDALKDPLGWHQHFLHFVGLHLPATVESEAARRSFRGGKIMNFPSKGIDAHVGGREATPERSFRDELMPQTLLKMDQIMRTWLPPVLLVKLGVPP